MRMPVALGMLLRVPVALGILLGVKSILSGGLAVAEGAHRPGSSFRDCPEICPELVVLPPGKFKMGSPPTEAGRENDGAEDPYHLVTIGYRLAVGKYTVTRGEWAAFVSDTHLPDPDGCNIHSAPGHNWPTIKGLNWHHTGFPQTDRHPAVCMSWNEAQLYLAWLSKKTGHRYRLLSESEWEYAARAGTTTPWFWGDRLADSCAYANGSDLTRHDADPRFPADENCRDGFVYTAPVGSFRPNAFGLYDMAGNVAQMTEDCLYASYYETPADGKPMLRGDCKSRINRGDTWTSTPEQMRSAGRSSDNASSTRLVDLGFRVARELP